MSRQGWAGQARLIAAYVDGLGFAPIAVVVGADGARISAGVGAADEALVAGETVQARWWCRRGDDAERIAAMAAAHLRRGEGPAAADPASRADDAIAYAASRRQIDIWSDADIAAQATSAIARVDTELEQLRRAGDLRTVNKSYQTYRLAAAARGERVAPYAQWMLGYKEKLVRELAAALRFL